MDGPVSANGRGPRARARLIELVGPAGAGKTTLARILPARDPRIAVTPGVWRQPRRWLFLSAILLIPTVLAALLGGAPLRWQEIAQMIRIDALRRMLAHGRGRAGRVIVLDEGPVFALSWLDVAFGRNGDPGYAAWRRRTVAAWGCGLDAVVRLDADDAVLMRRIRERAKDHVVKDKTAADIADFTLRYRRAFDRVLGELAPRGVRVVSVRTDGGGVIERVDELHHAIRQALDER